MYSSSSLKGLKVKIETFRANHIAQCQVIVNENVSIMYAPGLLNTI